MAGRGRSFTGPFGSILLGRISHIAISGMSPFAYGVANAIRAARDIAGATRPSSSTSNIEQNIDRGDLFDLKQP